jgi:hypothetical protein
MTDEMMNLRRLVEKTPDADLLREMIGFAAERLMELEVGAATGAGYGEKTPVRLAQRNGYRDRDWRLVPAQLSCAFPSCARKATSPGSWSLAGWPEGSDRGDQEACAGISTRSVDELVKAMGMSGISKSQVSRLCEDRWQGQALPRSADRGRLAISVDRRHLPQGPPRWPYHLDRCHHCCWRQRRWQA